VIAHLAVQLTPKGLLQFNLEPGPPRLSNGQSDALADRLSAAFARGAGHGPLHLGAVEVTTALPPLWAFWRDFAARFVTALTATPADGVIAVAAPDRLVLETLCLDAPPMAGAEYLTPETFGTLWSQIEAAVKTELAENCKDADYPFAFLATYTSRLSAHGKAQRLPLSQALAEFSGGKAQLLSLLLPVQKAAESCSWLGEMVTEGEIYHPMRWRVEDAVRFLQDASRLQQRASSCACPRPGPQIVQPGRRSPQRLARRIRRCSAWTHCSTFACRSPSTVSR
jgi:hypothetical protein